MELVRDVVGAVWIKDGKLFSAKRGDSKYAYVAHKYEFVGGKKEDGETCEEALKRECREEMDVEVKVICPFMTYRYEYPDFVIYLHTFIVDVLGEPKMLEHEKFTFIDLTEVDENEWAPADQAALKKIKCMYGDISEKTVRSEPIFQGHVVKLVKDTVMLPNGKEATREVVHHIGASGVLVIDDKNQVYFCRQYRYPLHQETLEIPAGKRDGFEEDYLETAKREMREELGVIDGEITPLGEIFPTVGYSDEKIALFLVKHPMFGEQSLDDDEFVKPVAMSLTEAIDLADKGGIKDAKTLVALYKYKIMTARS